MAENEKDTIEEENEMEEGVDKKGSPMKIIVPLVVILLILGGAFFAWKGGLIDSLLGGEEKQTVKAEKPENENQSVLGPLTTLNIFIVNLADTEGKRYLKVKMALELSRQELVMEIEERLPQLRDIILTTLSSKKFEDISNMEGKYQLRAELISMLNRKIETGKVKNIYFTEFIIQ